MFEPRHAVFVRRDIAYARVVRTPNETLTAELVEVAIHSKRRFAGVHRRIGMREMVEKIREVWVTGYRSYENPAAESSHVLDIKCSDGHGFPVSNDEITGQ